MAETRRRGEVDEQESRRKLKNSKEEEAAKTKSLVRKRGQPTVEGNEIDKQLQNEGLCTV